jgi:hypothetical protein
VKSYNSYCVEKLWVGSRGKRIEEFGPDEVQSLQKYLMDHGLDVPSFNALIRGHYHTRHFLPMGGQILNGKIKCLKFDVNVKESFANRLVIEADVGDTLLIEASRESVYIHGHWMGKADLSYVLEVGKLALLIKISRIGIKVNYLQGVKNGKDRVGPIVIYILYLR